MKHIEEIIRIKRALDSWEGGSSVMPDGSIIYSNNKHEIHRLDGPAFICEHKGVEHWYVNHVRVYNWQEFQRKSNMSDEEILMLALKWGDING